MLCLISKWVSTVCTFFTDDTAIWATQVLEALSTCQTLFLCWRNFTEAFRKQFETIDEAGDALTAIEELWQGKKPHAGRTNLSDEDKQICFKKHLSTYIKDRLSETDRKVSTLKNLIKVATKIDKRKRERDTERQLEQGRSTAPTSMLTHSAQFQLAPSITVLFQARDFNAMVINGTMNRKTLDKWRRVMAGQCFDYGAKDYVIQACLSCRAICQFCHKVGHTQAVCRSWYLGQAVTAAATASMGVPYTSPLSLPVPAAATPATVATTSMVSAADAALAALVQQIASLKAQVYNITGDF
ncbi:hypothetical protein PHLGIDRAFT_122815 [Phlebiopsis gigantea 11061_1 CR5-6]|uniref:Uncharacterized protein n=1 Tax=Phlebiopsis gigantea (strain 11061_1 CR5-6) TaxID=745531 RepID=A0A0C3S2V5_PHLG1|nr:hypothetical protein PHLGIDRAFT_122815 [Phlebiopsis gigantea 11061_1 CR5-6]